MMNLLASEKQNSQVNVRKKRAEALRYPPQKKRVQKMVEIPGEGGQKNWKLEAGGGGAETSRFKA